MEWWKQEEKQKYEGKQVLFNGDLWVVKHVSWNDAEDHFVYYLEKGHSESARAIEKQIEIVKE